MARTLPMYLIMKTFEFVIFDPFGKKKVGTVKAWSLSEAKRKIQLRGFYLASIKAQESSASYNQNSFSFFKEIKRFLFSNGRISV